jgi:hypothetical protein
MFKPAQIIALAIAGLAAWSIGPAAATPTDITAGGSVILSSTSSFIVGDLLYSFTSCSDSKNPGACTGNGSTTGGVITAFGTNGFIISGPGGSNFLSDSSTPPIDDVTLQFTVTTTDANYLDGVSYAIAGSGNFDSVNDNIIGIGSGTAASITTNSSSTAVSSATFVPTKSITVSTDVKSASTTGSTPSSVATTSQAFQTVPEPTSIMAFSAGLIGLAAMRRKRKS